MHKYFNIVLSVIVLGTSSLAFAEGEEFEPTSHEQLEKFYSKPERSVTVKVHEGQKLYPVPAGFLGINLSYFNVTDEIWQKYNILEKLKTSGIDALRYPGGEETSFFHWEHPGVNGYEDLWDPNEKHGTSPGRGRFQVTWVPPERWNKNEKFMNFDEFMQACKTLGAEPIVGLNLSSGRKHNRRKDGIEEAVRWLQYCKDKGYEVTYWFLDNEPWNWGAAYTFKDGEYAEEVCAYASVLKKKFPNIKLIANPTSSTNYNYWKGLEEFVAQTAHVIDFIDVHWYWGWGKASFDYWLKNTPLQTGDKWKKEKWDRPFEEDIRLIKETCKRAGAPHLGLVVLEWNVAPSDRSQTFNQSLIAIIQADLLMEFLKADVHLTCLWPLIWQSSRDVWSEQDFFPSIVTQDPPFEATLSLDMFRMFSAVKGKTVIAAESSNNDLRVVAAGGEAGHKVLLLVNKNALRRRIMIGFEEKIGAAVSAEMIGLKHQLCRPQHVSRKNEKEIMFYAEPFSFTAIRIE